MGSALHRHFQLLKAGIFKVWLDDGARDSQELQKPKKVQIVFQKTSENRSTPGSRTVPQFNPKGVVSTVASFPAFRADDLAEIDVDALLQHRGYVLEAGEDAFVIRVSGRWEVAFGQGDGEEGVVLWVFQPDEEGPWKIKTTPL